ncbi:hypothetical protein GCM10022215_18380 [Nocardioides fonticola]|uniref:HTH cro/C1-type domain-containing protein n=1 Tax=Nocardioides fonticola TaxID=450363 RepID=A0ABP7XHP8_9ACTN
MRKTSRAAIAANVRAELARRRVAAGHLGAEMGLSPAAMSRRLNGDVEFTVGELQTIAGRLGVPLDLLLAEKATA